MGWGRGHPRPRREEALANRQRSQAPLLIQRRGKSTKLLPETRLAPIVGSTLNLIEVRWTRALMSGWPEALRALELTTDGDLRIAGAPRDIDRHPLQ